MRTATNPETGERLMFDEDAGQWVPMAPEAPAAPDPRGEVSYGRGLATEFAQGGTFGFGDEMRGAIGSALDRYGHRLPLLGGENRITTATGGDIGDTYEAHRDIARGESERFQEGNPGAAFAANAAGMAVPAIAGGVAALTTGAGRAGVQRLAALPWQSRIPELALLGGAAGGLEGAVSGAGDAPEASGMLTSAARGGQEGAAIGALTGPAPEALWSGVRGVANAVRSARDPMRSAARTMERTAARSDMTPQQMATAADSSPSGIMADVSEPAREALENVTQQPGPARGMALEQLTDRSRRQASDLLGDLGTGRKFETLDELKRFREQEASPVYRQAFAEGVDHTPELEAIFEGLDDIPGVRNVWENAKRAGRTELRNRGEAALIPELGDAVPSLRGWQYVKRRLDNAYDSARRSGASDDAVLIDDARKRLLRELDAQNPTYARARDMWAGSKQFEDMLGQADRFMNMTGAEFERAMSGLSRGEREAMKISAVQAIEDRIQRGRWTHDVAKLFDTPAMDRKMRLLFDTDDEFRAFKRRLADSVQQQRTFDAVRGNSATARRQAARADQEDWISTAVDLAADAMTGVPVSAPGVLARYGPRVLRSAQNQFAPGAGEAARTEVARQMLETDPARRAAQIAQNQRLLATPALEARGTVSQALPPLLGIGAGFAVPRGLLLPPEERR